MENNPYAPSASSLEGGARELPLEEAGSGFRDLSGISGKLSVLLLVGLGWHVLSLISEIMQLNLLTHPSYTVAQASANDLRQRLLSVGELILYFSTVIVFGRWIYLAHKNLPELEARHLRSPGWAVGSFFVPFINLWAPYQSMRDLAKASRTPRAWELEETPPSIVTWWVLWLIGQALGNAIFRMSSQAHSVDAVLRLTTVEIASSVLAIPVYFLARHIVRRVWRDQAENRARMISGSTQPA